MEFKLTSLKFYALYNRFTNEAFTRFYMLVTHVDTMQRHNVKFNNTVFKTSLATKQSGLGVGSLANVMESVNVGTNFVFVGVLIIKKPAKYHLKLKFQFCVCGPLNH